MEQTSKRKDKRQKPNLRVTHTDTLEHIDNIKVVDDGSTNVTGTEGEGGANRGNHPGDRPLQEPGIFSKN